MIIKHALPIAVLLMITMVIISSNSQKHEDKLLTPVSGSPLVQDNNLIAQEKFDEEIADFEIISKAIVYVQTKKNSGSGFIIGDDLILTAYHVIEGYGEIEVRFSNGARRIALVKAFDTKLDIALIQVRRIPYSVEPLELEFSSTPKLGEIVWAWGYPYEKSIMQLNYNRVPTITIGIISAHRKTMGGQTVHFLQTDAAVNSGNSGGPLITENGMVVGMNINILTPEGKDAEGLNFALDITNHQDAIEKLLSSK